MPARGSLCETVGAAVTGGMNPIALVRAGSGINVGRDLASIWVRFKESAEAAISARAPTARDSSAVFALAAGLSGIEVVGINNGGIGNNLDDAAQGSPFPAARSLRRSVPYRCRNVGSWDAFAVGEDGSPARSGPSRDTARKGSAVGVAALRLRAPVAPLLKLDFLPFGSVPLGKGKNNAAVCRWPRVAANVRDCACVTIELRLTRCGASAANGLRTASRGPGSRNASVLAAPPAVVNVVGEVGEFAAQFAGGVDRISCVEQAIPGPHAVGEQVAHYPFLKGRDAPGGEIGEHGLEEDPVAVDALRRGSGEIAP